MNWQLAVAKNLEALKRVLAMLAAMVEMAVGEDGLPHSTKNARLPRHLHRFVLRLLRPAEAATRRLIIIAARGLVVEARPQRLHKPKPIPEPRTVLVLDRVNGSIVSVPMVIPEPPPLSPALSRSANRSSTPSFSLFDPMRRFGSRRRYVRPAVSPHIWALDGPRPASIHSPEPALPCADDPLDAGRLQRRLEAIG